MNWISVKDQLPKSKERVLTYSGNLENSAISYWTKIIHGNSNVIQINSFEDFDRLGITHWMPLPELPKEYNELD